MPHQDSKTSADQTDTHTERKGKREKSAKRTREGQREEREEREEIRGGEGKLKGRVEGREREGKRPNRWLWFPYRLPSAPAVAGGWTVEAVPPTAE